MSLRAFGVAALVLTFAACSGGTSGQPTPTPGTPTPPPRNPNVVVILADDMGWGDVSSFWSTARVATPKMDALAASGARLTDFYVTAPVCSPSRASLFTGRWPPRTGVVWVTEPPRAMEATEITIGGALRARGYKTAIFGKWHLGRETFELPLQYGFDVYWGKPDGNAPYYFDQDQVTADVPDDQVTRAELDRAKAFIAANAAQPFLLVVTPRIPHLPSRPAAEFVGKSGAGLYSDTILEFDSMVGEIHDAIVSQNLDRDTLFIVTSDNGPVEQDEGGGSAGPFFGRKQFVNEGGIRVPLIASWPGHIPAGRVVSDPASTLDFFPTFVHAAGGTLPTDRPYDGEDIGDLLTGKVDHLATRDFVFWVQRNALGYRSAQWKYIQYKTGEQGLYDLSKDPAETTDLTAQYPDEAGLGAFKLVDAQNRVKAGN
jgi:arylsulfatase A-like enzyme